MEPIWSLHLLGRTSIERPGAAPVELGGGKTAQLLARLALPAGRSHSRDQLAECLWPDDGATPEGRSRLNGELWRLRKLLEPDDIEAGTVIHSLSSGISLASHRISVDVSRFETAIALARQHTGAELAFHLERAIELYRGDLLPGCLEDWVFPAQRLVKELYRQALRDLMEHYERAGCRGRALEFALRALDCDPNDEGAHAEVIRLYALDGRQEDAREVLKFTRAILARFDEEPTAETRSPVDTPAGPTRAGFEPHPAPIQRGASPGSTGISETPLLPFAGAIEPHSTAYLRRPVDTRLEHAIAEGVSLVLLRGPRQVGKSSALAGALAWAGARKLRTAFTDLQLFGDHSLRNAELVFRGLEGSLAEQLDEAPEPWHPMLTPARNFERFVARRLTPELPQLVWAIDNLDRLLPEPAAAEVLALFRSLHNQRALPGNTPWKTLTVVLAYATEPRLYETNPNLSPWNVGLKLDVTDFTREELAELNSRWDAPLRSRRDLDACWSLLGGHPYLSSMALSHLRRERLSWSKLTDDARGWERLFGDHLRHLWEDLGRSRELCDAVLQVLRDGALIDEEAFYRLRTSGVLAGSSFDHPRMRCGLYARFLRGKLVGITDS